ncbi:PEP-CTERM sorting domain-containing protein [Xylophilus sp. GOD-11R]|uniref:PEP-CTERM sorting domain-containing protein n=1 Tax=Xylophilus sp. GOD-11R TaxID=3089814 RepID=UPI00298CDB1C|nr:PEP-CTERM sorting domain-containing protein [Xylophilus sp. GOD-11R]WPB57437.1 PEP-CTERM sorting domain-containing protein [Xylophilus sp. GOD-11R]
MTRISKLGIQAVLAAISLAGGLTAHAADYEYTGNTTGQPTYVRIEPGSVGQNMEIVPYFAFKFSVDETGNYTFSSGPQRFIYTFLYENSFVPSSPQDNYVAGSGSPLGPNMDFNANLTRGVSYIFVNTTQTQLYGVGPFTSIISGPGNITPLAAVPEPESYALFLAGLGLMGAMVCRTGNRRNQAMRLPDSSGSSGVRA